MRRCKGFSQLDQNISPKQCGRCVSVCVHICVFMWKVCVCVHMYVFVWKVCLCVSMYVFMCVHVSIDALFIADACVCMCMHMYINIQVCIACLEAISKKKIHA